MQGVARECPAERTGGTIPMAGELREARCYFGGYPKAGPLEPLPLQCAEPELDLIELRGVERGRGRGDVSGRTATGASFMLPTRSRPAVLPPYVVDWTVTTPR
jgi:hypothetical protein